jgi:hypothetical protein
VHIFLTLDIKRINDIRMISGLIYSPSHELDDTEINTPPNKVIIKKISLSYWALDSRSRWQRGLRRRPSAARLLRLWVRIPNGDMDICLL